MSEPIRATIKVLVEELHKCIEILRAIGAEETSDTETEVEELKELKQRIIKIYAKIES